MEPWGTPDITGSRGEETPFNNTFGSSWTGSSQAPPSSPSLFCAGMLGGACEQSYSSLARLPQQLHEPHALLSLLSWAYSACVLFAMLFQQRGALSRSISRFFFRLLRCLRVLRGSRREHDCAISTSPETSLCEFPYQLPLRFTSRTWL